LLPQLRNTNLDAFPLQMGGKVSRIQRVYGDEYSGPDATNYPQQIRPAGMPAGQVIGGDKILAVDPLQGWEQSHSQEVQ